MFRGNIETEEYVWVASERYVRASSKKVSATGNGGDHENLPPNFFGRNSKTLTTFVVARHIDGGPSIGRMFYFGGWRNWRNPGGKKIRSSEPQKPVQ